MTTYYLNPEFATTGLWKKLDTGAFDTVDVPSYIDDKLKMAMEEWVSCWNEALKQEGKGTPMTKDFWMNYIDNGRQLAFFLNEYEEDEYILDIERLLTEEIVQMARRH